MDINSLLNSLTDEDIEKLKNTAAQFMGGIPSDDRKKEENKAGELFGGISPEMISAVSKVSAEINKKDPRCDFISALKPLLSEQRGKKADDAVMMLKFLRIFESLKGDIL